MGAMVNLFMVIVWDVKIRLLTKWLNPFHWYAWGIKYFILRFNIDRNKFTHENLKKYYSMAFTKVAKWEPSIRLSQKNYYQGSNKIYYSFKPTVITKAPSLLFPMNHSNIPLEKGFKCSSTKVVLGVSYYADKILTRREPRADSTVQNPFFLWKFASYLDKVQEIW